MLTGLTHAHKYLGYLTFALAFGGFALSLAGARTQASRAALLSKIHKIGMMNAGRVNILLGFAVLFLKYPTEAYAAKWAVWSGFVAWGVIEPIGKRLVQGELEQVAQGGTASNKLVIGTLLEVLILTAVVGMMTMSRLGKL